MAPTPKAARAFDEGVRFQNAGALPQAEACFRQTLALAPDCAAAWVNLGLLREDAGDLQDAHACHQVALTIDPALHEAALNLGAVLTRLQSFNAAEAAYRRAIAIAPNDPAAWSNLGAMLACLRRDDEAQACFSYALALQPGYAKARFNLGYVLLRHGQLAEGFACLEARESLQRIERALDALPRWHGSALAGRRLLVVSDAAHGDVLQMARYAPLLRAGGAGRIGLCAQAALKRLLARDTGFDSVLGFDDPLETADWDCWAPSMSLPFLCGTELQRNLPQHLPYLHPDPDRVVHWRTQLQPACPPGPLRVGLVWRGNPQNPNDADRSLPGLHVLAPLGAVPGVCFYSLQHGAGAEEALAPPPGLQLEPLGEPLGDFSETAAIIANLDLVIAVDTSVVHLAAALGRPTWVLLPRYQTDWRWLEDRSDSPWYPGVMRLFRQTDPGDWQPVVQALVAALHNRTQAAPIRAGPSPRPMPC